MPYHLSPNTEPSTQSIVLEQGKVDLPPVTTMKEMELLLGEVHPPHHRLPSRLLVNMADVRFILVECLMALIAEIGFRQASGLETKLRLPRLPNVREIFRAWKFPNALRQVTGVAFIDLVEDDDHKFFRGLGGDLDIGDGYGIRRYDVRDAALFLPLERKRFFSFRHYDAGFYNVTDDPSRFRRAVLDETERWSEDPNVRQLLTHHLGAHYGYWSSCVVYESMSNAFRHGRAQSILVTSKADFEVEANKDRFLTFVIWDDGIPIYQTLRDQMQGGGSIFAPGYEAAPVVNHLVRFSGMTREQAQTRTSKVQLDRSASDEELLWASLLPGVTSDPDGISRVQYPLKEETQLETKSRILPPESHPGMGLTNLLNAVVDIFRGQVAFRSGDYFMNVAGISPKTRTKATNYSVKIERRWPFNGNMLTVRIPLKAS